MNNYVESLKIYFDNVDKESKKFNAAKDKKGHSHYPYGDSKCYRKGFAAVAKLLSEKYRNADYHVFYKYTASNMVKLDPNITIIKWSEKNKNIKKYGIYIYLHFPIKSDKREFSVSLELGGINDPKHSENVKILNKKCEEIIKLEIDNLKKYGNVRVGDSELLIISVKKFNDVEIIVDNFVRIYENVLKKLNIVNWKDSWENVKYSLFGKSEIEEIVNKPVVKNISDKTVGFNRLYYGGPGCGKSKKVEMDYCKKDVCIDKGGKKCDNYIRTTFYPDYTNSDFIGQLIPRRTEKGLDYEINPGPFTMALERAFLNKEKQVYLIIEEINRGNAAAIFGDVFQLLDRVNDKEKNKTIGESQYEISNSIIEDYFKQEKLADLKGIVKIPSNLSIIATMNTSDQNVYTLDSAFKRRWDMKYVSNKFTNKNKDSYENILGSMIVPMKNTEKPINWEEFVERINNAILDKNEFGINSEDKQIGKFFVGECDLITEKIYKTNKYEEAARIFAEKVLMYLWEDVAKIRRSNWFREGINSFETLLDDYVANGINVFSEYIKGKLNSNEK